MPGMSHNHGKQFLDYRSLGCKPTWKVTMTLRAGSSCNWSKPLGAKGIDGVPLAPGERPTMS